MTSLGGSLYLPTLGKTGPLSERITSYRDSVRSKYPERVISRPGLSSFRGMPRHVDSDQVTIGRSDEWYTTQCSYRKPTGYSGQPTVNSGTFLTVLSPRHRTAVETKDAQNEARQVKIASKRNRLAEEHALAVSGPSQSCTTMSALSLISTNRLSLISLHTTGS